MKTLDIDIEDIKKKWPSINKVLNVYRTQKDYHRAISVLNFLLDEIGQNEKHPLSSLIDTIGVLIEDYETKNIEIKNSTPIEIIKFLMEEHSLTQSELPEIGTQGVVSEVLGGKRELNIRQISLLAKRFKVSPLVFFEEVEEETVAA